MSDSADFGPSLFFNVGQAQRAPLRSPYPFFGGKSKVAAVVWERFGAVVNYVEPFFGSGAVLLGRRQPFTGSETVNDKDGFISNFWRAMQADAEAVATYADWPANETDLHARHIWLVNQRESFTARLEGDPDFYDAKTAGWWVWGMAGWIGHGFCSGNGPWQSVDGQLLHVGNAGQGVKRQRLHVGNAGHGVNRQRLHVGNAGQGVQRKLLHVGNAGHGVNRQRLHVGGQGQGVLGKFMHEGLYDYFLALQDRLARVRVCSGDWSRVCGPSVTFKHGITAVFLDPPYSEDANREEVYTQDDMQVAHAVREWALDNGNNPLLRIALCGYDTEHDMPDTWTRYAWKAHGGYAGQGDGQGKINRHRETIWFSPHCLKAAPPRQLELFGREPARATGWHDELDHE